jgi:hypothetical protein
MADVVNAFLGGRQAALQEQAHAQQLKDNKLRAQVLKHEIDRMKIDDQLLARQVAIDNFKILHGQPAADLPQEQSQITPENVSPHDLQGVLATLFGKRTSDVSPHAAPGPVDQGPGASRPQVGSFTRSRPVSVPVPGIDAFNGAPAVPGVSLRPETAEAISDKQRIADILKARFTVHKPGDVIPGIESEPPAGPEYKAVGAGGMAAVGPGGVRQVIGPAARPVRPAVVRPAVVRRENGGYDVVDMTPGPTQGKTIKSIPGAPKAPKAPTPALANAEEQRQWQRARAEFEDFYKEAARNHADEVTQWNKQYAVPVPGITPPPEPKFDAPKWEDFAKENYGRTRDWKPSGAGDSGEPPKKAVQPKDPLQVVDPENPTHLWTFPTKEAADAYRKKKGIR